MAVLPWWERFPGRLEWEMDLLEAAGFAPEIDEDKQRRERLIEVRFRYQRDGLDLRLVASFPDMYPYVRPEIATDDLALHSHQSPIAGNLCLIGRSTENWAPTDTLEWLVTHQLPGVILAADARARGDPSPVPEERQGEPLSNFHITLPGSALLFDTAWTIPSHVTHGRLEFVLDRAHLQGGLVRGGVSKVMSASGQILETARPEMLAIVPEPRRAVLIGNWVRLGEFPRQMPEGSVEPLLAQLATAHRVKHHQVGTGLDGTDVLGVLFTEELTATAQGDGWAFLARGVGERSGQYLVRAMRAGPSDVSSRIPALAELRAKTVLVVGLGGIGAPSALEFAKGGVGELRLVDHDVLEPGPSVRYPFGLISAGFPKGHVLAEQIRSNWPYTKVTWVKERIGGVRTGGRPEFEVLDELLDGVDLVYDATAERGIHHILSDLAREAGIAYIEAATRNGAWAGHVARVANSDRGCWVCLAHWLDDWQADDEIALAVEPGGLRQPAGCADPTFTGTGFDVAEIALAGVRLAVGTLLRGEPEAYPDVEWDVALINIRRRDGSLDTPRWSTSRLEPHPNCSRCRAS